ncbi:NAD(P)/FAD-dependent oxidoreductase [Sphingoaurantiacus capsulatus]|uniref:NAD(P)/FAD-dependent oxidoreductase n=1 Tax=Sphingoaurantiacus capsulatus TaxID=1771310 RepID=A0ABV7XE44_9SPHN
MQAAVPLPPSIGTLVIGGGIVGSCVAGFLADEGEEVLLVDDGRGGGSSSNAGSLHVQMQSRFMRLYPQNVPNMERQLPLYPKAVAFWRTFEDKLGVDFDLKITGGLMVAESQEQLDFLKLKAEREKRLGLDVEILDRAGLDAIAPYFSPAIVGAELCANEGKLNPLLCNTAIRRWIRARGVVLAENVAAETIERSGTGFDVRTSIGVVRAGRVVLAAAAGAKALAASIGEGFALPASAEPLHMNITEATEPLIGHLVQHADRMITLKQFGTGQIVIGGGWPARLADDSGHPEVELASLIANATLAQHIVPRLGNLRIIRTWAGINTSVDGMGVLGEVPTIPGLFTAIPGDAGYTLGPLSAHMVASAILGRDPGEDMSLFTPGRFI